MVCTGEILVKCWGCMCCCFHQSDCCHMSTKSLTVRINIQETNISLPSSTGMLLAGLIHYWVAWLVATQRSPLAKQKKLLDSPRKAVRWGQRVCV